VGLAVGEVCLHKIDLGDPARFGRVEQACGVGLGSRVGLSLGLFTQRHQPVRELQGAVALKVAPVCL
jgi:hypothetical protein